MLSLKNGSYNDLTPVNLSFFITYAFFIINSSHSEFAVLSQKLTSLSPQSVLDRGYAVVSYEGRSVSSSSTLKNNDNIMVQLAQGKLTAKIIEIDPK